MSAIGLLVLSVVPSVVLFAVFYARDRREPEPMQYLLLGFLLGMFSIAPAVGLEVLLGAGTSLEVGASLGDVFFDSFVAVGFVEESIKVALVMFWAARLKWFSELYDGIMYAVVISLGFATVENILYVLEGGVVVGLVRALLTVPMHVLTSVLIGYFVSRWRFSFGGRRGRRYVVLAVVVPTMFHGLFNFFLSFENPMFLFFVFALMALLLVVTVGIFQRLPGEQRLLVNLLQRRKLDAELREGGGMNAR